MAQATKKTSSGSKSRNGSQSTGKGAASRRPNTKRSSTNGGRARGTSSARKRSRPTAQSRNGAGSITQTAIDRTKAAGHAVADAASKAKTPLIAGGTALVGAAAGAVVKDRLAANRSKNPLKRLSIPKPARNLDLSKVDLDTVKSAAERVSAYGQQASDIASAVEKTRKKNK
jgi:hypothetical protein